MNKEYRYPVKRYEAKNKKRHENEISHYTFFKIIYKSKKRPIN